MVREPPPSCGTSVPSQGSLAHEGCRRAPPARRDDEVVSSRSVEEEQRRRPGCGGSRLASDSWDGTLGSRPRAAGEEAEQPRPQEDERPAPLARAELDGHAAATLDLAHHVLQPVVVERHVLGPAERRAGLAPAEPDPGAEAG